MVAEKGHRRLTSNADEPSEIFVVGKWLKSSYVIEVRAPSDNQLVRFTHEATPSIVDEAIYEGHRSQRELAALAPFERCEILRTVASKMVPTRIAGVTLERESGQALRDARTEIERSALTFRVASEEAERVSGEVLDLGINRVSRERLALTRRFPVSLVAGITPFNLPVSPSAHKIAPAMPIG